MSFCPAHGAEAAGRCSPAAGPASPPRAARSEAAFTRPGSACPPRTSHLGTFWQRWQCDGGTGTHTPSCCFHHRWSGHLAPLPSPAGFGLRTWPLGARRWGGLQGHDPEPHTLLALGKPPNMESEVWLCPAAPRPQSWAFLWFRSSHSLDLRGAGPAGLLEARFPCRACSPVGGC